LKKYNEYLEESLALQVKSEPKTAAAKEARKMGLTYMGFGRYSDRKGNLAYIVHNDRLVPYKSEDDLADMHYKAHSMQAKEPVKKKNITASKNTKQVPDKMEQMKQEIKFYDGASKSRGSEDKKLLKQLSADVKAVDKELIKFYQPGMFDDNEMSALEDYTADGFGPINRYLYKGIDDDTHPDDVPYLENTVEALDSAFEETQAPFDYTVYSGLSERYSANKFAVGGEYIFRGYVSSSLDFNTAIGGFADVGASDQSVVLQIEIKKGQKSIYVDAVSANAGEQETLLPRGSKIQIVSGPHLLDPNLFTDAYDIKNIALFHCKIVEEE
jgi:hypothetical protein